MKLLVLENATRVAEWGAQYVAKMIRENCGKWTVLGLPTGKTPMGMYTCLVNMYRSGILSFREVKTFNISEYAGLCKEHPQSFNFYMYCNLFNHVDISPCNINTLDGAACDPMCESDLFEKKICDNGGMDLLIAGIGTNGNLGFNEPGSSLTSKTRVKTLSRATRDYNSVNFDNCPEKVPEKGLTMGLGTIMSAREVVVLAAGAEKADAIAKALEGPVHHMWPASVLQHHRSSTFVIDCTAALGLTARSLEYARKASLS